MALDFGKDLVVHWPAATAAVVGLLRQVGARGLLTEPSGAVRELATACAGAGIVLLAEVPAAGVQAARDAGFHAAIVRAEGEQGAFRKLVLESSGFIAAVLLSPEQIGWDVRPAQAVLRHGVWPGIASPGFGTAGATESVWLDANTSLVAQLRALYPWRRAVLGYRPDKDGGVPETRSVPPRSAEVALADAYSAGGNVILSLPENYRQGLLKEDERALETWKSLVTVHEFLKREAAAAEAPLAGRTAVLCGSIEESGEILNLAFRKNLCPVAVPAAAPGALTTGRFDVVVAVNVPMTPAAVESVARFAMNGGAVLAAPAGDEKAPWWTTRGWRKVRTEEDRDVYAAGRGVVYGYHMLILDPGAFALDLKEVAGQRSEPGIGVKNLDLRVFAADTVLGVLHRLSPSRVAAVLTAYGNTPRQEFLVSLRGRYRRGTMRQAGSAEEKPLELMVRTGRVEINLTQLSRVAVVELEE